MEMFLLRRETHAYLFLFFPKPSSYLREPLDLPPPSSSCFCCGKPGHYAKNCPVNRVRLGLASGVTELLGFFTLAFM